MKLYVRNDCPHCQALERVIETYPGRLREQIRVTEINFQNRPPNVARVPTLITQDGSMLVGENVFSYLKQWRHDASPPHTEAFMALTRHKFKCLLLVLALILASYWYFQNRAGGGGGSTTRLGFAPPKNAVAAAGALYF